MSIVFVALIGIHEENIVENREKNKNKIKMIINESSQQAEDPEKAIKERPIIKKI